VQFISSSNCLHDKALFFFKFGAVCLSVLWCGLEEGLKSIASWRNFD
jgi:hypothetical protein